MGELRKTRVRVPTSHSWESQSLEQLDAEAALHTNSLPLCIGRKIFSTKTPLERMPELSLQIQEHAY
jgi:hypothetical protein